MASMSQTFSCPPAVPRVLARRGLPEALAAMTCAAEWNREQNRMPARKSAELKLFGGTARPDRGCRHRADAEFTLSGTDLEHAPEDTCPI